MKAYLDHIGIAVADLGASLAFFRDALGLEVAGSEEVTSQRVRAHFVHAGRSSLELLEATAPDSPIARYLGKRGPGLHHVAYGTDDIESALEQVRKAGLALIDEQPRTGIRGSRVAFLHPKATGGVLTEIVEPKH